MKEVTLFNSWLKKLKDIKTSSIPCILIISIIFLIFYVFTNRIPEFLKYGSEIIEIWKDLSISTIAAWIFFYFQVYIPQKWKNASLKKRLVEKWKYRKSHILYYFWEEIHSNLSGSMQEQSSADFIKSISNIRGFSQLCEQLRSFGWFEYVRWILDNQRFIEGISWQFSAFVDDINQIMFLGISDDNDQLLSILEQFRDSLDWANGAIMLDGYRFSGSGFDRKSQIMLHLFFKIFLWRYAEVHSQEFDWIEERIWKLHI